MKKLLLLSLFFFSFIAVKAQQDAISTKDGEIQINPINHGALVLTYQGTTIYVDPYGGAEAYKNLPDADLILITDIHGDHLDKKTLSGLHLSKAAFIVPEAVKEQMGDMELSDIKTLKNGEQTRWKDVKIEALPMYNLPETADSRHPKGRGNGYVLTLGDKRIYISGDTEDIPEMRALKNIDIAFVCMNLPYTMDIDQAADAVLAFQPSIVYPYHYRGQGGTFSDVDAFKQNVESQSDTIEVRLRKWY